MSNRFVRQSKFKHVFPQQYKKNNCYDNAKVTTNAWDSNLVKVNPKFIAVNWKAGGGGAFAVIDQKNVGRLPERLPLYGGHAAAVLDTDFNPFNDHIIASASEDTNIMLWQIPEEGPTKTVNDPLLTLNRHTKKVGQILFHPCADNVLASSSADLTIRLWDIEKAEQKQELQGHTEVPHSFTWNWTGDRIASTCRDKTLRIFDPRANKVVQEAEGHAGVKGSRVVWLGDSRYVATTGFSKTCDRQLNIWDTQDMRNPLKSISLDTSAGVLMPHYDNDTKLLFLAGKGDGNIRFYEFVPEEPFIYPVSEYKSPDPQRGIGFLPKRAVNVNENEVARAYKVTTSTIEPISFIVPRKSDGFQADVFIDTPGPDPALSADQYFNGETSGPKLISLSSGYVEQSRREFTPAHEQLHNQEIKNQQAQQQTQENPREGGQRRQSNRSHQPTNEKEYREAYHRLVEETQRLQSELSEKDERIRELENQLQQMK